MEFRDKRLETFIQGHDQGAGRLVNGGREQESPPQEGANSLTQGPTQFRRRGCG